MTDDVTVVYVHGAGPQDTAEKLKVEWDGALFGGSATSVVARYAHVFWERMGLHVDVHAEVDRIAQEDLPPSDTAEAMLKLVEGVSPADQLLDADRREEVKQLIAAWFEELEGEGPGDGGGNGRGEVWDWIFREIIAHVSADVGAYFYGGWADDMREPVAAALRAAPDPLVVVAHSLGSIVTYDVLCAEEFRGRDIRLLLTAGSPLGISNVARLVNDGNGRGTLPTLIPRWANFADWWDPVPFLGRRIGTTYGRKPRVDDDDRVDNERENNHDLVGYLVLVGVREAVADAVGPREVAAGR
jgi:hypothetical protein